MGIMVHLLLCSRANVKVVVSMHEQDKVDPHKLLWQVHCREIRLEQADLGKAFFVCHDGRLQTVDSENHIDQFNALMMEEQLI